MRPYIYTVLLLFLVAQLSLYTKIPVFGYLQTIKIWLLVAALGLTIYSLVKDQLWLTKHKLQIQKVAFVSLVIFAFLVFFLLPTRRIQSAPEGLGDSLWLVEILFTSSKTIGWWASFDEILEPFIRSSLVKLATHNVESILFWLGIYSSVCGFLLVFIILFFFRNHSIQIRIASFLLLFFVPSTQIFLNYIEHYSFAALSIITILLLIWKDLDNRSTQVNLPVIISGIAAIGILHHLIVGFLLPALLVYLVKRSATSRELIRSIIQSSATSLFIIAIGWFFYFVILQESAKDSHLWHPPILSLHKLFSSANLVKVLSILLFTSPLSVAVMISKLSKKNTEHARYDSVSKVLIVAITSFLLQLILWNPIIGLPADWDLLSFVSIPIHIFILRQLLFNKSIRLIPIAMLTLLPAMLWWWSNHQKSKYDINLTFHHSQAVIAKINQSTIFNTIPHQRKHQLLLLRLYSVKLDIEIQNLDLAFENAERVAVLGSDSEFDNEIAEIRSLLETASVR